MKLFPLLVLFFPFSSWGQASVEKAKVLYENKKYDAAVLVLKGIPRSSGDYAAGQFYLGRIYFDKKEYSDAADYFENASEANPTVAEYFSWLGDTYGTIAQNANVLRQGLLAPKMKRAWEAAIALDPKNLSARGSLIQFYLQATGFMGGSVERAREVAGQIMKINVADGHQEMGTIFLSEKKPVEAEKEFLEMVKVDPTYATVLANFYIGQKKYDKGFAVFEDMIKHYPDDYTVIYQLGKTAALSGQKLDRGDACLRKYLTYQPKSNEPSLAGANMRLGQIKEKQGSKTDAKKYYEQALKLDPSLKEATEGLVRVKN